MDKGCTAQVVNKSLRSLRSGSKVTQIQYLLFRTTWPRTTNPRTFNSARFNLAVHTPQARQMLLNSNAFQNYLGAVGTNASQGLEGFKVPLLQQWEILAVF